MCCDIKNFVQSLKPCETPSYRRLTRLQTMYNGLEYRKTFQTVRCSCGSVAVIFSIYLNSVLYLIVAVVYNIDFFKLKEVSVYS